MATSKNRKLLRSIFTVTIAILVSVISKAQSLNPLNYSGQLFVESFEFFSTPRYISYNDHAIIFPISKMPSFAIIKLYFDFQKSTFTTTVVDEGKSEIINQKMTLLSTKKYKAEDGGWAVVLTIQLSEDEPGTKNELVWEQYGNPYMLSIKKNNKKNFEGDIIITKTNLSSKPKATSVEEAFLEAIKNGLESGSLNPYKLPEGED